MSSISLCNASLRIRDAQESQIDRREGLPQIRHTGFSETGITTPLPQLGKPHYVRCANFLFRRLARSGRMKPASSTTNPVEIVKAISERLSSVYPGRYITANVP